MICPHKGKINNISNQQKWGKKNDPPNNSSDKIGTYLEIANYTQLVTFFCFEDPIFPSGFPTSYFKYRVAEFGSGLGCRRQ